MGPKKIKSLFLLRFKKIGKYYLNIPEDFDLEEIHAFRLEVKKTRAFLRLLNLSVASDETLKLPGKFREFYSATGQLRNLQLHVPGSKELAAELNLRIPDNYLYILCQEQEKQKHIIREAAALLDISKIEKRLIKKLPGNSDKTSFRNFIIHQKLELLSILNSDIKDETLHTSRKLLKDLQYNFKYINSFFWEVLPSWFLQKKNLEELTENLGKFQDLCVAQSFFGPSWTTLLTQPEHEIILIIFAHLEEKKNQLKTSLHQNLMVLFEMLKNFEPAKTTVESAFT